MGEGEWVQKGMNDQGQAGLGEQQHHSGFLGNKSDGVGIARFSVNLE